MDDDLYGGGQWRRLGDREGWCKKKKRKKKKKKKKVCVYYFLDYEDIRVLENEMRCININHLIKFKIRWKW